MPLLEQRRRPRRDAAPGRYRHLLTAGLQTATRWWPPAWAALFLLGAAAGAALPGPPCPGHGAAGRLAALLPLLLRLPSPRGRAAAWCLTAAAAACWGQGEAAGRRARVPADAPAALAPAEPRAWRGALALRLTGYPAPTATGRWRAPAAVLAAADGDGAAPPGRGDGVWLLAAGAPPAPGAVLVLPGTAAPPAPADLPGGFDLGMFLAGRGLAWSVRADAEPRPAGGGAAARAGLVAAAARDAVARRLARLLPPREARLGRAVLLGWRTAESRTEAAGFTALGLAHLFAVSGLHVGILAGLVLAPAALSGLGPGSRAWLLATATCAFVVLTGAPGSVVRAGTVVALAAALPVGGRRVKGLRLLGVVFWGVVVWDPRLTLDVGVRLSYLAAAGIVAANSLTNGFAAPGGRVARAAAAGVGVSLAAQWSTLPVVAGAFGQVNGWSPLANLAAVPLFGLAVWLLAAAAAVAAVWPWAAEGVAAWSWVLIRGLELGAVTAGTAAGSGAVGLPPPGPGAVAAWLALTAVACTVLRGRQARWRKGAALAACLAGGLAVLGPLGRQLPPRGAPLAVQFAVGQGDCALVVFPDRWAALIDTGDAWRSGTGPFARDVVPWLRRQGLRRLDAVVLTHGHRDHTGGAAAAAAAFPVGAWLGGGGAARTVDTGPGPWLRPGPPVRLLHRWRDWSLAVLDPAAAADLHDENDRSLAVVLARDGRPAMVWTGDLERAGEEALLAAGLVPAGAGVWKAGHHGSATSGTAGFLDALRPGTVIVSCGVGNRYGHPSHGPYVVAGDTVPTLRTDLQGTVTVSWPDGSPRVRALRPLPSRAPRRGRPAGSS